MRSRGAPWSTAISVGAAGPAARYGDRIPAPIDEDPRGRRAERGQGRIVRPASRPRLNIAELVRRHDEERFVAGPPFSRTRVGRHRT